MDHIRILKRAFHITINYRAVWFFGFLLALTSGGGSGGSGGGGGNANFNNNNGFHMPDMPRNFPNAPDFFGNHFFANLAGVIGALICLVLVISAVMAVLHYVSRVASIRMANEYEASGEKVSWRQGWRMGWSRLAWRAFLANLLVGVVTFFVFIVIFVVALLPLLALTIDNDMVRGIGVLSTIGMMLLAVLLAIVAGAVLSIFKEFYDRAIILEGQGVFASYSRAVERLRRRLSDTVVMALILFGVDILWVLVTIPVAIVLLMIAAAIGGVPGGLVGLLTAQFAQGALPWVLGLLVGVPLFMLVFFVPLWFAAGLKELFVSNSWTLAYREIAGMAQPVNAVPYPLVTDAPPAGDPLM